MKRNFLLVPAVICCMGFSHVALATPETAAGGTPTAKVRAISFPPDKSIQFEMQAMSPMMTTGQATVATKGGTTEIEASFKGLGEPSSFGPEYLVYVLWAVTPEGKVSNLGPISMDGLKGEVRATTRYQTFALGVTAEPYFAVTMPSDTLVLANAVPDKKNIQTAPIEVKADLQQRGRYKDAGLKPSKIEAGVPIELYQARNAVQIARWQKADKYAAESFNKAVGALDTAEAAQKNTKAKAGTVMMAAREAVQFAEDSRGLAVKRAAEERVAADQKATADREAAARAQVEADAQKVAAQAAQAQAQAEASAAQAAQAQADAQAQAKASAAQAAQAQAQAQASAAHAAHAAQAQAQAEAQAKASAAQAEAAQAAVQERRANLLKQLNRILATKDTDRGLVATMTDVTFASNSATLQPSARESLAKLAGVVSVNPGLMLDIEGYTDNVGGDEHNQTLSEKRAAAVRDYLAEQGISATSLTAKGLGKASPVVPNDTSEGRAKNRRVEIVVSGEAIGTKTGG